MGLPFSRERGRDAREGLDTFWERGRPARKGLDAGKVPAHPGEG